MLVNPQLQDVASCLAEVRRRVESAGGDPGIRVVAVTKGFGPEAVQAARRAGLEDLGENYASELLAKAGPLVDRSAAPGTEDTGGTLRWHFLGRIQRNKVGRLAPVVSCWQSVARVVEGEAIARRRPRAAVLVEVDVTGAQGHNGCAPAEAPGLVTALAALDLDVRGLMTVAPPDRSEARQAFRVVRELADRLGLPERSMGMSGDLEEAVKEGSTMLRIGRALFGDRPIRPVAPASGRGRSTL